MRKRTNRIVSVLFSFLMCLNTSFMPVMAEGNDAPVSTEEPVEEVLQEGNTEPKENTVEEEPEKTEEPGSAEETPIPEIPSETEEPVETEVPIETEELMIEPEVTEDPSESLSGEDEESEPAEEEEEDTELFANPESDFTYTTSNGKVTITKYNGTLSVVEIPSTIDGKPVTAIGEKAFYNQRAVIRITIPDEVTQIGKEAFFGCTNLESIILPSKLTSLEKNTFSSCSNLSKLVVPESVKTISEYVFTGCDKLTSIGPIGSGSNYEFGWTSEIPDFAFEKLTHLTDVTIPEGIKEIGKSAFENCVSLKRVILPSGLTTLGISTFSGCTNLTKLVVPASLTTIGDIAFKNCSGLKSAGPIGSGCDYEFGWTDVIPSKAFFGCSELSSAIIPDGITTIGKYVFVGTKLSKLRMPASVTSIESTMFTYAKEKNLYIRTAGPIGSGCDYEFGWTSQIPALAFSDCDVLSVIEIPDTVTDIGASAFSNARCLNNIVIPEGVTEIKGSTFWGCTNLVNISFPTGLKKIGKTAFYNCDGFSSFTVPYGVTSLGDHLFTGCDNLLTVKIPGTVTSIGYDAFALTHIKDLFFGGSEEQWEQLKKTTIGLSSTTTVHYDLCLYGHNYGTPVYTWIKTDDGYEVNARTECLNDSTHFEEETVPASHEVLQETSCETDGIDKYNAVFENGRFSEQEKQIITPAWGHDFEPPVYTWNETDDGYEVTASTVCKRDKTHTLNETVTASFEYTEEPVKGIYTAEFENELFETQTKEWIFVTGVSLNQPSAVIRSLNETVQLNATVEPQDASNSSVIWTSSDENVVTVNENGLVTPTGSGTATVTVTTADGGHSAECTVKVAPSGIYVDKIEDQPYTGSAITPDPAVYDGTTLLTKGKDYTVSYKNNKKAGTASITIKMKGNYKDSKIVTFNITKISLEDKEQIEVYPLSVQATGKTLSPVPTVYFNGKKLKNKTDFTVAYPDNWDRKQAGPYSLTITGKGNFEGSREVEFVVGKKNEQVAMAKLKVSAKTVNYSAFDDGYDFKEDILSKLTVKNGKTPLTYGVDYEVEDKPDCQKIGTCSFVIKGKEGTVYTGERKVSVKVTGISISDKKVKVTVPSFTYTGEPVKLDQAITEKKMTIVYNGVNELVYGTDYEFVEKSYKNNLNTGTASVQIQGKNRFSGTRTIKFKIIPQAEEVLTVSCPEDVPYEKGGAKPAITVTDAKGNVLDAADYTVKYSNNIKANQQGTAVISFKRNYKGAKPQTVTFNITPASLENKDITVKDLVVSTKAGGYRSVPVLYDPSNGKKLKAGTDYEKTYDYELVNGDETTPLDPKATVAAGKTIRVKVTGINNYSGTVSAEYRIISKGMDISKYIVSIPPQEYTGNEIRPDASMITVKKSKKADALTPGEHYEVVGYSNNIKKGTATVTIRGKGEYGGTKTVKFKITQRSINTWWSGLFGMFRVQEQ